MAHAQSRPPLSKQQMERSAEHYQELYSRETVVTDSAVENMSPLPVMEELDDTPTIE